MRWMGVGLVLSAACTVSGQDSPASSHPSCPPDARLEWHPEPVLWAECSAGPGIHHGYSISYDARHGFIVDCYDQPQREGFVIGVDVITHRVQGTRAAVEPQVDPRTCAGMPLRPLWDEVVELVARTSCSTR
ncbi:MAG TPA: hypothetical protein VL172_04135 [Kofleriaceae bacterium]|nr:hypothetical protein [Kofleriaceae bacterium]